MKARNLSSSASRLWKTASTFLLLTCAGVVAHAQTAAPAPGHVAPAAAPSVHTSPAPNKAAPATVKNTSKPYWNDLTPAQHQALAPLATEWNKLGSFNKEKWLELSKKFGTMTPTEQERLHERMRDWVKLTPEQRRAARENYARVKKLTPEQRALQWQQYQQLSEEKKKELAATAPTPKKAIVNPPLRHGKPPAKTTGKAPAKQPEPKPEGIQPSTVKPTTVTTP